MAERVVPGARTVGLQVQRHVPLPMVALYTVGGSLIAIAQRYLTFSYDTFTQNGFRFMAGALCLLAIAFVTRRAELTRTLRSARLIGGLLLLSLSSIIPSFLGVEGIRSTSAALAGLIGTLGVPLTITLAVILFPDERQAARGPRFIAGSLLALCGTVGLAVGSRTISMEYSTGVIYLLLATLLSAFGSLLTKRLVIASDPLCVSGLSTFLSASFFLSLSILSGGVASIGRAPAISNAILVGSGVYGLLLGGGLYMVIIRKAGLITARFADLVMPVFTAVFGFVFLGELLAPAQLLFGGLLLAGCFLILSKRGSAVVQVRVES